ncbi:MAG: glycoside hydrolase [Acidobacteriota bacterium]
MTGRAVLLLPIALAFATPAIGQFAPNQPYASFWFPDELLTWSPDTDPDAPYNRAAVPLQSRFLFPGTQVNGNARAGEGLVAALSIMHPSTSFNPSQGAPSFDVFAFNYWQYIDTLVFWGGSAGEGLILAPNPGVIDAAHRNGVKVLGTIFFPPNVFGGQIQWVQDLVQMQGATYPVADKLIEVAETYGFEGWFINQETNGGDTALATAIRDFVRYIHDNSSLEIMWYDSMIESGPIAWQNQLNSLNDAFFEENAVTVGDQFFLNFFWNNNRLISSAANAQALGRSPYDLFAGADVQANGYNTVVNWGALFPDGQTHRTSLGLFAPNWTWTDALDNDDFYTRANRFWVGANRDPRNTTTPDDWKGIAHYVPAWSAIDSLPFVTHFNTGQGRGFSIDGEQLSDQDWHNRGLQEILPTWRWIMRPAPDPAFAAQNPPTEPALRGGNLRPDLDWSESYYGGTSLKVAGNLGDPQELLLFKTKLPITTSTSLQLAFKTGFGGPSHLEVGVAFEDGSNLTAFDYLAVGNSNSADWNLVDLALDAYDGETLAAISLRFAAPSPVNGYQVHIGRIAVSNGPQPAPQPVPGLEIVDQVEPTPVSAALRLTWIDANGAVLWYNLYRRNPDNSLTYLGSSTTNALFVAAVPRIGDEITTTLVLEPVGPTYVASGSITTTLTWKTFFRDGFESGDTTAWDATVQ